MSDDDPRERYIDAVLSELPQAMPGREQIAVELRAHIAERLDAGMPVNDALALLGDPRRLAESYVSAVELVPAPMGRRFLAKLVDLGLCVGIVALLWLLASGVQLLEIVVIVGLLLVAIAFPFYFIIAEYIWGTTIGKRLLGLYVVREAGTRIGIGQSFVRQFPTFFQFLLIDAAFIPFTERRQRAFEIVSGTRVVAAVERRGHDNQPGGHDPSVSGSADRPPSSSAART